MKQTLLRLLRFAAKIAGAVFCKHREEGRRDKALFRLDSLYQASTKQKKQRQKKND